MTKEHIYSTSAAETAAMLAAFLQTHAVPTYFDSVELSDTIVVCKIGNLAFLTLECDPASLTITNDYGVYQTASSAAISSIATAWRYAYACDGGVCLSNYATGKYTVTITKNSDGKTTVIYDFGQLNTNIFVISPESVASTPTSFSKRTYADPKTVLTPFLVSAADGAYTPTVSMLTYTQHTNDNATLIIDGTECISNGSWVVKDTTNANTGGNGDLSAYALRSEVATERTARMDADAAMQEAITGLQQSVAAANYLNAFNTPASDILSGGNLDDYTDAGVYKARNAATAGSLLNCPVSDGFRLEVRYISDATRRIQTIYPNNASGYFYMRNYTATGWGSWYKYGGEPVAAINAAAATAE